MVLRFQVIIRFGLIKTIAMASDYPNSKECEYNKPYLYSLNTTLKTYIK